MQNQVITANNGQFAEIIYRVNPQDFVNPNSPVPAPTVIHNALNNVPPRAGFAFGNRYELGYRDAGNGWMVGVLDGPEQNQSQFFGFAPNAATGRRAPAVYQSRLHGRNGHRSRHRRRRRTAGTRAFGFGSVPVMFETAPGFMQGFRDYMNNFSDALLGTQRGPYAYVGNYGAVPTRMPCRFRFLHLADDINGNGIWALSRSP